MRFTRAGAESGFSLVETLIATAILATALAALAELIGVAITTNAAARATTVTSVLAGQKLEQLRALSWGLDFAGSRVSDTTTDTSVSPEKPMGGTGLTVSPVNTLQITTNGYVDYLAADGTQLGGGAAPPTGTVYIRRWMIEPLPTNPDDTLIIHVLVTRRRDRGSADLGSVTRMPQEARLMTIKTRKAQ
jgi:prepilin-type N-terminal cleavage/methylation domain-containing protein